jgi:hypothetical protein
MKKPMKAPPPTAQHDFHPKYDGARLFSYPLSYVEQLENGLGLHRDHETDTQTTINENSK